MAGTPRKEEIEDGREETTQTRLVEDHEQDHSSTTAQPADIDERIPPTNDQQSALEGSEDSVNMPEAASSPERPVKIPVNFDDSSISNNTTSPISTSISSPPPTAILRLKH
jgi:hypothetical protein